MNLLYNLVIKPRSAHVFWLTKQKRGKLKMIFKSSRQLMAGTIAAALCVTAVSLNSSPNLSFCATPNQDEQFFIDGYHYEFNNMSNIGECSFEPDYEGGFDAAWSGIMECQFEKGLVGDEIPNAPESVIINYDLEFNPVIDSKEVDDGSSRVGICGWLNPRSARYNIEYAIIDYQCNFDTANYVSILELENIGSYEIDGMTYDLYNKKPSNTGFSFDASVEKYFSFRRDSSIGSGASVNLRSAIDLTKHMEEWEKFGMEQSNIYSAMFDLRAWMSSGTAKLNSCDINITEKEREAFTEDGYFYEVPINNDGNYEMKPLGEGGFEAEWDGRSEVAFRKGRSFSEAPFDYHNEGSIIADYDIDLSAGDYSDSQSQLDISLHGWLDIEEGSDWKDEFNIVLGRKNNYFPSNYRDFPNDQNVIELGTVEDDGKVFKLYRSIPTHNYGVSGITEMPPHARYTYWSVADDYSIDGAGSAKLSGSIDIRKHLDKFMEKISELEKVSNIYELSLDVNTVRGDGNAKVNKCSIILGSEKSVLDIPEEDNRIRGKIRYYCWGSHEEGKSSMTPNEDGGFSCQWDEGEQWDSEEFKSFSEKLEAYSEISDDDFTLDYDTDIDMFANGDVEWALCGACKSTQSNLEYYVFESYSENTVSTACTGTSGSSEYVYSFLRDHSILKRSSAIINGDKYDLFYLRYRTGGAGVGGYDVYRCVSVKQNAAVNPYKNGHISGSIDWTKHIMVWDSVGFPVTAINSCEFFFETNSPRGEFSLNTCNFNANAKETLIKGDLNGDGTVDNFDVIACRRILLNPEKSVYDAAAGDMNENGKLDVGDLILLNKFILGMIKA